MTDSWHPHRFDFVRFFGTALLRAVVAFSALAVHWAIVFVFIDGDNPLRSDDPYLVGFVCGAIAAVAATVYTIAEDVGKLTHHRIHRDLLYAGTVTGWCLSLWTVWAATRPRGEGSELLRYLALASLVTGLLVWPLCRFRLPIALIAAIVLAGVLLVMMYFLVVTRMFGR
jgi:hypothetical protein